MLYQIFTEFSFFEVSASFSNWRAWFIIQSYFNYPIWILKRNYFLLKNSSGNTIKSDVFCSDNSYIFLSMKTFFIFAQIFVRIEKLLCFELKQAKFCEHNLMQFSLAKLFYFFKLAHSLWSSWLIFFLRKILTSLSKYNRKW